MTDPTETEHEPPPDTGDARGAGSRPAGAAERRDPPRPPFADHRTVPAIGPPTRRRVPSAVAPGRTR